MRLFNTAFVCLLLMPKTWDEYTCASDRIESSMISKNANTGGATTAKLNEPKDLLKLVGDCPGACYSVWAAVCADLFLEDCLASLPGGPSGVDDLGGH